MKKYMYIEDYRQSEITNWWSLFGVANEVPRIGLIKKFNGLVERTSEQKSSMVCINISRLACLEKEWEYISSAFKFNVYD
jgi:hypothetical protein